MQRAASHSVDCSRTNTVQSSLSSRTGSMLRWTPPSSASTSGRSSLVAATWGLCESQRPRSCVVAAAFTAQPDSFLSQSLNPQVASPVEANAVGFPFSDCFDLDGKQVTAETAMQMVAPFAFDDRLTRIEQVVSNRTYTVLPIVEHLFDMGNLAAICRTADALGYGSVHCINRTDERYKLSQRTAAGADKWLDVRFWNSTASCLSALKGAGYQVVVTHLTKGSVSISDVDWTKPTAFILGNEKHGVSDEAVAAADACVVIPMTGFVESFNVSVAAALIMWEASQQRIRKLGAHGDLTAKQQEILRAAMVMRSVRESRTLLKELLARPPPPHQAIHFKDSSLLD